MEPYYTQEERIISILTPEFSDKEIADRLNLTSSGIWHALIRLREKGMIEETPQRGGRKWVIKVNCQ